MVIQIAQELLMTSIQALTANIEVDVSNPKY
jgi:hypothetical protein